MMLEMSLRILGLEGVILQLIEDYGSLARSQDWQVHCCLLLGHGALSLS